MNPLFWTFHSAGFTMKIRSRSPKSNQLFPYLKQCIYTSLVKIHRFVQKITHGNPFLDISKCGCDLENYAKVTKIKSTLSLLLTMYLCKFGQNPSTSSEDKAQKPFSRHFSAAELPSGSLFWYALLYLLSSFAIILMRKKDLLALLWMSCYCKYPIALPDGAAGWYAVCDYGIS